ncbi:radical SAM protein [Patescibacteria group bacterium]|nr:radical SAM protein [Patescibacteria group bacterium]
MRVDIREIQAKSVLTPSSLPGAEYVVNPYVGCTFGCKYCFAAFIGRWKHPGEEWGSFLDIKTNAPEILLKDLKRLSKKLGAKNFGTILFSSVTDPYLGQETKYKITQQCLQVLVNFNYEGKVAVLTKSPLVTRDINLFQKLNSSVGLTLTTLDDKIVQFLEGNAPPASARLNALQKLNSAGVETYVFVGPLLPYFTDRFDQLDKLFNKIEATGTKEIWLEHINLSPKIKERLFNYLQKEAPELTPKFQEADTHEYRDKLEATVKKALRNTNLNLAMGSIIFHGKVKP